MRPSIISIALIAGVGCTSASPPAQAPLASHDWDLLPLAHVCEQLQEWAEQSRDLRFTAANLGFVRKADMAIVYVRLWQTLDPDGQRKLAEEQDQWSAATRLAAVSAGNEYVGGSLESIMASTVYANLTELRCRELRRRLPDPGR